MADYNLVDQLGSLTADQLATITFEAGVTADDGIPGYGGLTSTGTYWSYACLPGTYVPGFHIPPLRGFAWTVFQSAPERPYA